MITAEQKSQRTELLKEAKRLTAVAEGDGREMTFDETRRFDELMDQAEEIELQGKRREKSLCQGLGGPPGGGYGTFGEPKPERVASPSPAMWEDVKTGDPIPVLGAEHSLLDLAAAQHGEGVRDLSLGRVIRASIVGDWSRAPAEAEFMAAMGTGSNSGGGYLVPDPLASRVIDLARAKSVLMRAGARTVPMTSDTLAIARVATDPTFETKTENAAFTGSTVVLDRVLLTAYTIGTVVDASRELAEDAPNFTTMIENVIASALAVELDRLGLVGTGSAQPLGLENFTSIQEIASVGSPLWTDFVAAVEDIEQANGSPNAWITSSQTRMTLANLLVAAEANHYAPTHPVMAELTRLQTESVGDALAFVGDFMQFIVGLRQGPRIEISTEAGNRFDKHQVGIKVTWRGAFNAEHHDHFAKLTGITA